MRSRRPPQIVATPGVRPFDAGTFGRLCRPRLSRRALRAARFSGRSRPAGLPFAFLFQPPVHPVLQRDAARVRHPRRIERAKMPLLAGNHSVTEICFEVGYESLGSFSTRFSSLTGLSPATFRGEARRTFGGFGVRWPLYYIPGCFQRVVLAEHQAF